MTTQYLIKTINGKLQNATNQAGTLNAIATVGPSAGEFWCIASTRISTTLQPQSTYNVVVPQLNPDTTQPSVAEPYCALYVGASNVYDASTFVDDTNLGAGDTSSIMSPVILTYGDTITAKWRYIPGYVTQSPLMTIFGRSASTMQELQEQLPLIPGARFTGSTGNASVWTYMLTENLAGQAWSLGGPTFSTFNTSAELISCSFSIDTSANVGNRFASVLYTLPGSFNSMQVFGSTAIAANTFATFNFAQGLNTVGIPSITGFGTYQTAPLPTKYILPPNSQVSVQLPGVQAGDLWSNFVALWRLYTTTTTVSYT